MGREGLGGGAGDAAGHAVDEDGGAHEGDEVHGVEEQAHERVGNGHGRNGSRRLDQMDVHPEDRIHHLGGGHHEAEAPRSSFFSQPGPRAVSSRCLRAAPSVLPSLLWRRVRAWPT